jgi:membrane protein
MSIMALGRGGSMDSGSISNIIRRSLAAWYKDEASSMGAAIAFYTLFSIAPILLIVIWVASSFVEADAVQSQVLMQVQLILGDTGAAAVRTILDSTRNAVHNGYSSAVSVVALLIGATSVFGELQKSLNRVWRTPQSEGNKGLWQLVRSRLLSFGLVLCVGFLLLVSLIVSASLEAFNSWLGTVIADWRSVAFAIDVILGFVVATVLFAMIYKYVPREKITWGDVWVGALVTSTLFTLGKLVIVVYFGKIAFSSAYGVAGSFLVLMLWVYYSAQIFLLGAEFTYSYAYQHGSRVGRNEAESARG